MKNKYCFVQDDSCHWYCISVGKKDAFDKWIEAMENGDDYDEDFEDFEDYRLDKHVSDYSFENMEEI